MEKNENSGHGFSEGSEVPKEEEKNYTHFDMLAAVARQTKNMYEENASLKLYVDQAAVELKRMNDVFDENKELKEALELCVCELEANYKRLGYLNSNVLEKARKLIE